MQVGLEYLSSYLLFKLSNPAHKRKIPLVFVLAFELWSSSTSTKSNAERSENTWECAFDGVPAQGEPSEPPAKKMIAEYFDANLSVKYLEAAKEFFPSLRKSGTVLQVQSAACRDDWAVVALLLLSLPLLGCFMFGVWCKSQPRALVCCVNASRSVSM